MAVQRRHNEPPADLMTGTSDLLDMLDDTMVALREFTEQLRRAADEREDADA